MNSEKKKFTLGVYAKKLLLWTLPIVLVQVIFFAIFLFVRSGYELAGAGVLISVMLDGIGKSLILSVFASLLLDLMEKRDWARGDH